MLKIKKSTSAFFKNSSDWFTEYTTRSTIHGLRYLGEKQRPKMERLCWLILFVGSVYLCVILINRIWMKWEENPVLISFAPKPLKIWQIPFPAVTVCSDNKLRRSLYNYTLYQNRSISSYKLFADISVFCPEAFKLTEKTEYQYMDQEDLHNITKYVIPDLPFNCKFYGLFDTPQNYTECKNLFSPILTNDGACLSFNMLDKSDLFKNTTVIDDDFLSHPKISGKWNPDNDYFKTTTNYTFPRRAVYPKLGLKPKFPYLPSDMNIMCNVPLYGYKVLLHHPAEYPVKEMHYVRVEFNRTVQIGIDVDVTTTSSVLRDYDPKTRQCFFADEGNLKYFKVYTYQNCYLECLTKYTLGRCNCVAYYMPHNNTTKICGVKKMKCVDAAKGEMDFNEIESEVYQYNHKNRKNLPTKCNCLPSCTTINYIPTVMSDAKYDFGALTVLQISFKSKSYVAKERHEFFGDTDFWASCGGLFGLFIGFSFLSLVEIVYFLIIRVIGNSWNKFYRKFRTLTEIR